ncbi:Uncharacterized protein APZ42_009840, partial [Daphnia magna]
EQVPYEDDRRRDQLFRDREFRERAWRERQVRHDPSVFRSRSPRRRPDYSVAYDPPPFFDVNEAYGHQYDTQFDPYEYDRLYYDDRHDDRYDEHYGDRYYDRYDVPDEIAETDADYDGDRPGPAAGRYEEDETVEQGRSWRPRSSEGRPTGETDGIVAEEPPTVLQPTLPPLAENAQDAT